MPEVSYREASKIQLLEAPRLAPGVCAVCGASRSDDRQYIDMKWDIDFYGVVYLCTFCFTEAVNTLGCLTKEQSEALEAENDRLRQEIIDFRLERDAIHDIANKLRDTGLIDFVTARSSGDADSVVSPGAQTLDNFYASLQSNSDESSSKPKQSDSEQGSDGLSDSESTYSDDPTF